VSARSSLDVPSPFTQVTINTSATGPTTLVSAIHGMRVKVFRMKLIVGAASTVEFLDGATPLDVLVFPQAGTMVLDFSTIDMPPWYQTSIGNAFAVSNSGSVQLSGNFDYIVSGWT
jgi:hypothetical protein